MIYARLIKYLIFSLVAASVSAQQIAVSSSELRLCWSQNIKVDEMIADEKSIFIKFSDGVASIDSSSGEIRWKNLYGGKILAISNVENGKIAIVYEAGENLIIRLLSTLTGLSRWQKGIGFNKANVSVFLHRKRLILVSDDGRLIVFSDDGKELWSRKFNGIKSTLLSDDKIIVASTDKNIYGLDLNYGTIAFQIAIKSDSANIMLMAEDKLLFGDLQGKLAVYDMSEKRVLWEMRLGGQINNLASFEDKILAVSRDNFIYLLSLKNGDRLWKRRFENTPYLKIFKDKAIVYEMESKSIFLLNISTKIPEISTIIQLEDFPDIMIFSEDSLTVATANKLEKFSRGC
ncbi:MAG: hypothetical protein D6735_13315 [Acidobacteria bacterium]|nr:MAG: hypothetical protein D6735_13315 [Acidobacteriota bacterium]